MFCELPEQKRVFLRIVSFMLKHLVEQDESHVVDDADFCRLEELPNTNTPQETRLKYMLPGVLDLLTNNWVHPRHKVNIRPLLFGGRFFHASV